MSSEADILDFTPGHRPTNPDRYTADGGKRFLNFILDRIFLYILFFGLGAVSDGLLLNDDIFVGLIILLFPGYYILPEYFWGKTPAKFITRTTVVTQYGKAPKLSTIMGRTLCRFIPLEQFSFLGGRAVGWHDSISKTRVVNDNFLQLQIGSDPLEELLGEDDIVE